MYYYTTTDSPPWLKKKLKDVIYLKLFYHKQWKSASIDYFYDKFSSYVGDIQLNLSSYVKNFGGFLTPTKIVAYLLSLATLACFEISAHVFGKN